MELSLVKSNIASDYYEKVESLMKHPLHALHSKTGIYKVKLDELLGAKDGIEDQERQTLYRVQIKKALYGVEQAPNGVRRKELYGFKSMSMILSLLIYPELLCGFHASCRLHALHIWLGYTFLGDRLVRWYQNGAKALRYTLRTAAYIALSVVVLKSLDEITTYRTMAMIQQNSNVL
ncbi:hypothetical protein Tco_0151132 [Tanacetum coccineum]